MGKSSFKVIVVNHSYSGLCSKTAVLIQILWSKLELIVIFKSDCLDLEIRRERDGSNNIFADLD